MGLYDIHGFVIEVEGSAENAIRKRFGDFRISETRREINLSVKPYEGLGELPTHAYASRKGIHVPFGSGENILWYQEGVESYLLLRFLQGLMWWPDAVPIRASAMAKDGRAFLFVGWSGIGKTSTVFNLLRAGYEFLSDDWLLLDGKGMSYPISRTIHLHGFNFGRVLRSKSRLGIRLFYDPAFRFLSTCQRILPIRFLRYAAETLTDSLSLEVDVEEVHDGAKVAKPTSVSKVFYMERKDVSEVVLRGGMEPEELTRRLAYIYLHEWNFFFREYYKYAYLYGIRNEQIEQRHKQYFRICPTAFASPTELYSVDIPKAWDMTTVDLVSTLGL